MRFTYFIYLLLFLSFTLGCDDFVEVDPPRTDLTREAIFESDETAQAAMAEIYFQIGNNGFAGGSINSVTLIAALSADDLVNAITWDNNFQQMQDNSIIPANSLITFLWQDMYACIYKCNAIIEGLDKSHMISAGVKQQLLGEAKFLRAFSHFYLVNLFGDVPLVLTTNYELNQAIGRNSMADVYEQIVIDLIDAKGSLPGSYSFANGERTRASQAAATALLARVYLYLGEWANAEEQATLVIEDDKFTLMTELNEIFLKNSSEAILQFYPRFGFPGDFSTFIEYGFHLSSDFVSAFEAGDRRNLDWNFSGTSYKYNSFIRFSQYSTALRLAEQYLIRAEARLEQDNISGAQDDLNVIRMRAGLGNTPFNDGISLLPAIEKERRFELFNEWGHRWLDLKRRMRIDDVLKEKKSDWATTDALYPIPEIQIENSLGMRGAQNPGY